eukprot:TRINITY_DN11076_c0_g1_i21.p1 TRINITY_DN11076_c0_g1~~TRINITY_DN11076_c0_g1_i21.p1  ORF type:complete len:984 (-),score=386.57 TRINITY_DN11076_c0_g1_i21:125-3076(-)
MSDPTKALNDLVNIGYNREDAKTVLASVNNNFNSALEILINKNSGKSDDALLQQAISNSLQEPQQILGITPEEIELNKAIELSMKNQDMLPDLENPEKKLRKEGIPVGLRNMGNTCYFNCLLQIYFMLPQFVKRIMEFKYEEQKEESKKEAKKEDKKENKKEAKEELKKEKEDRKKTSLNLVMNLQKLFSHLICSNRRYIEPTAVLKALVDDYGNPISIGDQKDAGEFNIIFLAQINEALKNEEPVESSPSRMHRSATQISPGKSLALGISAALPGKLDTTFINDSFFGEFQVVTRAVESDGQKIELTEETAFGQINVNAMENNIYEGWDINYFNEIEDFKTPKGEVTKAEQEYWVTKLPSVLFLQLQRVYYDKEKKSITKIINPVEFEKIIYVDRFMKENQEKSSAIRAKVRKFKAKIKELENALEKYKRFGASKLEIENVLDTTTHFLASQSEAATAESNLGVKLFSPLEIGDMGYGPKKIKEVAEIITKYSEVVKKQIAEMKTQLADYNHKVAHSYDGMQSYGYKLHSIIIHSGQADSGHYFAYICDVEQNKWRKYNDIQVTEVPEEEVMKTSIGEENSTVSAYFLVYVSRVNELRVASPLVRQYSLTESKGLLAKEKKSDYYTSLLPAKLKKEVIEDNERLNKEVEEYRAGEMVKGLQRLYTDRYEVLQQLKDQKPFEHTLRTFNFVCYLEAVKSPFVKWELLNCSLKEMYDSIGIPLLDKYDPVYLKIKNTLMKVCNNAPKELDLTNHQQNQLEQARTNFESETTESTIRAYLLNKLLAKDWDVAQRVICHYFANKLHVLETTRKNFVDIAKMLSLILSSKTSESLMQKDTKDAIEWAQKNTQLCLFVVGANDPHTEYVLMMLKYILTEAQPLFNEENTAEITKCIKNIEEKNMKIEVPWEAPEELTAAIRKEIEERFKWKEAWKEPAQDLLKDFLRANKYWYDLHQKVYKKVKMTPEDAYAGEKEIGIDFKLTLPKS